MADRRDIFVVLLNNYLERRSGEGPDESPEPFFGTDIEVSLKSGKLLLSTKHFQQTFAASPAGMIRCKEVIDELAEMADGGDLGDEMVFTEQGYQRATEGREEAAPDEPRAGEQDKDVLLSQQL